MAKRSKLKKTTRIEKGAATKAILIPCVLVLITTLIYFIWWQNNQNSTYNNIMYIRSFMTSSGKLNDFQNKIDMHNPETDIKWFKTDKEIRIEFGRIFLTWEPEKFYQQENLDLLSTIGITAKVIKSPDNKQVLHLYYQGKELERWVK